MGEGRSVVSVETFEAWMRRVDQLVVSKVGVSVHDLADAPWRDYYTDGMTPSEALETSAEWTDLPMELLE